MDLSNLMQNHPQGEFMKKAIEVAKDSARSGQYAIGAVVVGPDGNIISIAHTATHETNDATAHAEVNAIRSACSKLNNRYLSGCWLYTTLEPCPMCASAAIWAKMEGIVFGASKEDAQDSAKNIKNLDFTWRQIDISAKHIVEKGDPKIKLIEKFMQEECQVLFRLPI
jgi:tRNA(Arg) A34 adenosine deaminase TadA